MINLFISGMHENKAKLSNPELQNLLEKFIDGAVVSLRDPPPTLSLYLAVTPTGELAAMAGLSRTPDDALQNTAELLRISVDKQWRQRGVCKMLLAHVIRIAVRLYKVDSLYLTTAVLFEQAVRVYLALGFREAEHVEGNPHIIKMVMQVEDKDWWRKENDLERVEETKC